MAYRANRELGLSTAKPYQLRLPKDLRKRVEESAQSTGRSLNAELVRLIEAGLWRLGSRSTEQPAAAEMPVRYETEIDRAILDCIHRLSPEKQLALFTLLKPSD
ncbi:MAG: Arc family DNA-binding protein [Burkholderiales bacterium]